MWTAMIRDRVPSAQPLGLSGEVKHNSMRGGGMARFGGLLKSRGWVAFTVLAAILATPGAGRCGWHVLSAADGLAANSVSSVVEDRTENLWFGTAGGVSRYDGATWRTFTTADGLAGNYVHSILEDRAGNYWFGTDAGGVSRYDGSAWRTFTTADGLAANYVQSIVEDHAGNLWFGSNSGVSRYDGATWRTFTTADGLADNYVRSIVEDRAGNLWFGTSGGVNRYDGATWRTFTTADGLAGNDVVSILEDRSGNLWFGTPAGVSRYDGTTWKTFSTANGLASDQVDALLEDRNGNIWAGGPAASRYDGSSWRTFPEASGVDGAPRLQDRSGNLWYSHIGIGAVRYDGSSWRVFGQTDGLVGGIQGRIIEDRGGTIWADFSFSGLRRYDGSTWNAFAATDSLLTATGVPTLLDHDGNLWLGNATGASRYDGSTWQTFTTADGLVDDFVTSIVQDRSGSWWFGTNLGASRYDGSTWQTFTADSGLASNEVFSMLDDHNGNVWFASYASGVTRFDGSSWQIFTTSDGLPSNSISAMLEDHLGNIWFATDGSGVARFDGSSWKTFTTADGLASDRVACMVEDHLGNVLFGTNGSGVSRYDGARWRTFTMADGLIDNWVPSILEDHTGNLWFGSIYSGVTRYEPDRVPPQTVFLSVPPHLTAARDQGVVFTSAFGETQGIDHSYRLDGGIWSDWSRLGSLFLTGLAQGSHVLEVRSRDDLDNIEQSTARTEFEVDAEPPLPVISAPTFGNPVRGTVEILGAAADARFASYRVDVRSSGAATWSGATVLAQSASPVASGVLAPWDTTPLPDGGYDLRLSVTDSLGLTGTALSTVIVDNHAPFFAETAPTKVPAATGGDVYTTNAETHLYFPPHAFAQDAIVMVTAAAAGSVPGTLPSGAAKVADGYDMEWASSLQKFARFTMSYAGASVPAGTLALYRSPDGTNWERLGGTVDASAKSISLAVSAPGHYALFADNGAGAGTATLSPIAFTPRVFSPSGAFADKEVGISFSLGKAAPVTVKVYSRSGRLIREVAAGLQLNAGANLLHWDGRDRDGGYAVDGMYLVTVEALGHTETKTLAVVK